MPSAEPNVADICTGGIMVMTIANMSKIDSAFVACFNSVPPSLVAMFAGAPANIAWFV
jgi:hypothetical protein